MPFTNLNSRHLAPEDQASIIEALDTFKARTRSIAANLTADERRSYGSINELNKGIVNKAKSFNESDPELSSPDVDWKEYNDDYGMRVFLERILQTAMGIVSDIESSKILFDHDNYTAANADYAYTQYKLKSGDTGYQNKYDEMKQFYPRTNKPLTPPEP